MVDFREIYRDRADDYDRLVSREDYEGNLLRLLQRIAPKLQSSMVVEFGAGTGRLTRMLAPYVAEIRAFDNAAAMLEVARRRLDEIGASNCTLAVASNESLPVDDGVADLAIAGWTFGHLTGWHPEGWRDEVAAVIAEMRRVTKPGGRMIVIETLGTGRTTPEPPTQALREYYETLQNEFGFERHVVRTDYRFASVEEAGELTRFFFGDALADRIAAEELIELPECTGVWVRAR